MHKGLRSTTVRPSENKRLIKKKKAESLVYINLHYLEIHKALTIFNLDKKASCITF